MHLTPKLAGFDQQSIDVLTKLKENLLHICNDCKDNRKEKLFETEKPESSKIEKGLNELKTQMTTFQESIGKPNDLIETVLEELKRMRETKQKSNSTVVGNKTAGLSTTRQYHVTAQKLGIRISGIQESSLKSPDERMHSDIEIVEEILEFLKIKDKRLAKIYRIGKYEAEKEGSRTVVIEMESEISRDLVIKSAHLLKIYNKKYSLALNSHRKMQRKKMRASEREDC